MSYFFLYRFLILDSANYTFSICRNFEKRLFRQHNHKQKSRVSRLCFFAIYLLYHPEMLECIQNRLFLFWWAYKFFALAVADIIILSLFQTVLLFDLGNV